MRTPDGGVVPYATTQSQPGHQIRPDRPLLEAVLFDDNDPTAELMVSIDAESSVTVRLYAPKLEASGSAKGQAIRFEDHSTLATAGVSIIGYDLETDVLVTGSIDLGLAWITNTRLADLVVEGSALLDADWRDTPTRFSAVRRHPFNHDGLTHHDSRRSTMT